MFSGQFETLLSHYATIERLIDRTDELLHAEHPDLDALARLRWEEARALREYQLFKHLRIFAPATAEGGSIAQFSRRLEADCIAAGEEFRAHVMRWSGCVPASDWPAYRLAARAMMDRVRRHLAGERRGIESLLRMRADVHAARQTDFSRNSAR